MFKIQLYTKFDTNGLKHCKKDYQIELLGSREESKRKKFTNIPTT